jgi:pyrroloquinoline quinone biosynthesis protein B
MPVQVTVLGSAQDGGVPQPGCVLDCCRSVEVERFPVTLGITAADGSTHLIEASRELGRQMRLWGVDRIDTVSLSHAHLGHVDGLGLFGREVMNVAPRLHCSASFATLLSETPAWSTLPFDVHIWDGAYTPLEGCEFTIEPVPVPHRAELSDNHALIIQGPEKRLLFMPDHDDWNQTLDSMDLRDWLNHLRIDIALIDGTFWSADELRHRDMSDIPHPPVQETLALLGKRREGDGDVLFFHLNHTNPLCFSESDERRELRSMGWNIAEEGDVFTL